MIFYPVPTVLATLLERLVFHFTFPPAGASTTTLMAPSLLILTDFFQAANGALNYATNLAAPLGARLVLLHVRRDSALDPERFTGQVSNLNSEAIALAFSSLTSNLAVPIVAEVGHGEVTDAVADAVSRHHPTLIVLGRPDPGDTPEELFTTTSLDLLRAAPYPMLVVPHTVRAQQPPHRVVLAVDGQYFTLGEHARTMRQLLATLHVELTILHIADPQNPASTLATALESVLRTGLTVELTTPIRTRSAVAAHPAEGILHAARPEEFDLVMIVARRRSFWGELFHRSVTAQVLLGSSGPVLVLPAED